MTLTKAVLATTLFEQLGPNKREATSVVDRLFEEIAAALEAGDSVKLRAVSAISCREKPPRPGRNPKTGKEIPICATHSDFSTQFDAEEFGQGRKALRLGCRIRRAARNACSLTPISTRRHERSTQSVVLSPWPPLEPHLELRSRLRYMQDWA